MHKSRLGCLVIDCGGDDFDAAADFWSAALGYPKRIYPDDTRYIGLNTPDGEMKILLQRVEHPSRVHLDIETDDIEAEVARLEKLGATRVGALKGWVVMEAPSGHRFCVVKPQRPDFNENATGWPDAAS